jgi:hypothetical protein
MKSFRELINLVESLLNEDLSNGSRSILKDKRMVSSLGPVVRDDVSINPRMFPKSFVDAVKGSKLKGIKPLDDNQIAEWILTELDKIENEGYQGVRYAQNGSTNRWVVEKYIQGGHDWEDITGKLSMNLSKWYFLRNRNLLEPSHKELGSFKSIKDLANYLVYHYAGILAEYEESIKSKALKAKLTPLMRAVMVVDNESYKITLTLNRAANILYGLGSTWCTANSNESVNHFNSYASRGMLFQIRPTDAQQKTYDKYGQQIAGLERYQFDAGSMSFMNIGDISESAEFVKTRFPYLYTDVVKGLKQHAGEIKELIKESNKDEELKKDPFGKVVNYNVSYEIKKLHKFVEQGFMTEEVRPGDEPPDLAELPPGDEPPDLAELPPDEELPQEPVE